MSEQDVEAGWYIDPDTPGQQRYWDGDGWTDEVAPQRSARRGVTPGRISLWALAALGIAGLAFVVYVVVYVGSDSNTENETLGKIYDTASIVSTIFVILAGVLLAVSALTKIIQIGVSSASRD